MKIHSIHLYSRDGQRRDLKFKADGLNIITGRSSTGKSALSEIIEYCMGTFNVQCSRGCHSRQGFLVCRDLSILIRSSADR